MTEDCLENLKEQLVLYVERAQQLQEADNSAQTSNTSVNHVLAASAQIADSSGVAAAGAGGKEIHHYIQRRPSSMGKSSPSFSSSPTEMITDVSSVTLCLSL